MISAKSLAKLEHGPFGKRKREKGFHIFALSRSGSLGADAGTNLGDMDTKSSTWQQ